MDLWVLNLCCCSLQQSLCQQSSLLSAYVLLVQDKESSAHVSHLSPILALNRIPPVTLLAVLRCCRLPPQDVAVESGELLHSEYVVAPGAAIMLEAVVRPAAPPPQARAAVQQASTMYQRMGQV
jgi:hypothetical protein